MRKVICNNFKRIVESSEIQHAEIVRLTKVSESTFYRWMKGVHAPEVANVEKLAEILNVSPLEFYRSPEETVKPALKLADVAAILSNIPEEIFTLMRDFPRQDEAWEGVRMVLEEALESRPPVPREPGKRA